MTTTAELVQEIERLTQALADKDLALMEQTEIAQAANRQAKAKQAKVDRLMMEYCPDEISVEQMAKWEANQRIVSAENAAKIETMVADIPDVVIARLVAPQQHAQAAQPKCNTCDGTGVVDDGEIDCYPNGEPFMNGPVKCVKDCPDCTDAKATPAQPIAGELPTLQSHQVFHDLLNSYSLSFSVGHDVAALRGKRVALVDFIDSHTRSYGHQCRAAALEEAAKSCEAQNDTDWPTPLGCAATIRALNKTEG
jgi:hypothetical protein